jgi:hypothetical protein
MLPAGQGGLWPPFVLSLRGNPDWTPDSSPLGANLKLCFDPARPPHPALSRGGERVLRIPSLDGRGKGEGDK